MAFIWQLLFICCLTSIAMGFTRSYGLNLKSSLFLEKNVNIHASDVSSDAINQDATKVRRYNPSLEQFRKSKYSPVKKYLRNLKVTSDMKDKIHFRVDANSCFEYILSLAREGKADAAMDRFLSLEASDNMKLKDFNMLLKALGDSGNLDQCRQVMSKMKEFKIDPSIITYSTLISRAGMWKKTQLAEIYYNEMILNGIIPDVQAYNSLINAYAKSGNTEKAMKILHDMEHRGIIPNIVTFNTLLDSCARSGDIRSAREMFQLMNIRSIHPDFRSYSSLVHACCQAGDIEQAIHLVAEMENNNFPPNEITYSLLLNGLGNQGELYQAFKILDSMKAKGLRPNVVTMTSLVNACGKNGQLDLAFQLYEEMIQSKAEQQRPNTITCSSLVDACLKAGQIDRAFMVCQFDVSYGIEITYL